MTQRQIEESIDQQLRLARMCDANMAAQSIDALAILWTLYKMAKTVGFSMEELEISVPG